jgi:hypothetical protein
LLKAIIDFSLSLMALIIKNDYKVIDKAVKKSYSDWLNKRVREDNISETALKSEADSILCPSSKTFFNAII